MLSSSLYVKVFYRIFDAVFGCDFCLPGLANGVEGQASFAVRLGEFEGFDIDFGRAIAAAIFGDATKIEYRPLTASERLPALRFFPHDAKIVMAIWGSDLLRRR